MSEKPVETDQSLDFGKKKKKKTIIGNVLAADITAVPAKTTEPEKDVKPVEAAAAAASVISADGVDVIVQDDETLNFSTKKKKKVGKVEFDTASPEVFEFTTPAPPDAKEEQKILSNADSLCDWHGTERDYTYDELLTRVINIMFEKNPDLITGDKKKFIMKPPQVARVGTKKTSFSNFADICKLLKRQEKHLLNFLLAELGTSGSLDINKQLTIKGRFQQKQIENVLRRYIKEYVTCHTCRSPDTNLVKEERLFFLQCEICGSRCSVASIKLGFQAQVGKRAAVRARAT